MSRRGEEEEEEEIGGPPIAMDSYVLPRFARDHDNEEREGGRVSYTTDKLSWSYRSHSDIQ